MVSIVKINEEQAALLSELSIRTFYESHGHSASEEDINRFVTVNYNADTLKKELQDEKNIFHFLYYNDLLAGFSKVILNYPYGNSTSKSVTKLERIYLLKEFYNLKLGQQLLTYNINLLQANNQSGVWLFVWTENKRAIDFYKRNGFVVIGNFEYKISETHSNPNHQMLRTFQ